MEHFKEIPLTKKILFTGIIIIISQLFLVILAESFIRLYIHFRYGIPGKTYGIYMGDKELGAIHRPNSYNRNSVINNWGFRNIEDITEQKRKGTLRIYCSGGSATFCYNLPTEESWPSMLQKKLRQIHGHEHDEVMNAGEIRFAVSHEFVLAKRLVPRLKPDVVILYGLGVNEALALSILKDVEKKDINQLLNEEKWGVYSRKLGQARFLMRNSVIVKLYDYKIKQWFEEKISAIFQKKAASYKPTEYQWMIKNFENTLRAYLLFLRDNGCRVIIVRYGDNGVENPFLVNYVCWLRDQAVEIGKKEGAIIYDLATLVEQHPQKQGLYIRTGIHVTKKGAEFTAEVLVDTILKHIKI